MKLLPVWQHPRLRADDRSSAGFALVATLTLMILLVMVAVSLLSLASITLRAGGQIAAQSEAEANARLALMLALGELQLSLGPDQIVTAPSGIFDDNSETADLDGVKHPHVTGVWQARNETLGQTPDYSRTQSFRRWLVSNVDETSLKQPEFVRQGSLVNPVFIVKGAGHSADGRVEAGRLPVGRGNLAWWVGDENCKALVNPRDDVDRRENVTVAELLSGFATPGSHGVIALDGLREFPSNTSASDKLISHDTLPLVASAVDSDKFFHDLSPHSRSVLANVTSGGLRKDLSLYLERTDSAINWLQGWGRADGASGMPQGPLGPNGKIALSNPDDYDVLAWKHLHHWYHMHRRQLANQQDLPVSSDAQHHARYRPGRQCGMEQRRHAHHARVGAVAITRLPRLAKPGNCDSNDLRHPNVQLSRRNAVESIQCSHESHRMERVPAHAAA